MGAKRRNFFVSIAVAICAVSPADGDARPPLVSPSQGIVTATPTAPCVPTALVPPFCATHCEPCPTIRPGCYAQPCIQCIENPVCAPGDICVPLDNGLPGCCSCKSLDSLCRGDCDLDGAVAVSELVRAVNIALGRGSLESCRGYACAAAETQISCLVESVSNALVGCSAPPSATPTNTCTPGSHPAPSCAFEGFFTFTPTPPQSTPTPPASSATPTLADRPCTSCSFVACVVNHLRGNCARDQVTGVCGCRTRGATPTIDPELHGGGLRTSQRPTA